jgi:hypothetical protein
MAESQHLRSGKVLSSCQEEGLPSENGPGKKKKRTDACLSHSLRKTTEHFLIGQPLEKLQEKTLPTNRDVLRYFCHVRHLPGNYNKPTSDIAFLAVDQAAHLYMKGGIPMMTRKNAMEKVVRLQEEYRQHVKNAKRITDTENAKRQSFSKKLESLCELGAPDAMEIMQKDRNRSEEAKKEDIAFLLDQRSNRKCYMSPAIDRDYSSRTQKTMLRHSQVAARIEREEDRANKEKKSQCSYSCHDNETPVELECTGLDWTAPSTSTARDSHVTLRLPKNAASIPAVAAAADRCKVSSRQLTMILSSILKAGGACSDDVRLSQSTVLRARNDARKSAASEIQDTFQPPRYSVLHWDGKQLADERGTSERLAVLVSGDTKESKQGKLLAAHALDSGTAKSQTNECIKVIEEWGLASSIVATCFDTTATNTGRLQGTAVAVEKHLDKKLLYLACRHHCHELMLKDVWETLFGKDQGPSYTAFKELKTTWDKLEMTSFHCLSLTPPWLVKKKVDVCAYLAGLLSVNIHMPRDDYKEMVQLTLIVLGQNPTSGVTFHKPGAIHKARWMAVALYGMKMFLFREQLQYSEEQCSKLHRFVQFITLFYVPSWMKCTLAADAPANDLALGKDIGKYKDMDLDVGQAAFAALSRHTWYLCPELVPLALASRKLTPQALSAIARALVICTRKEEVSQGKPVLRSLPSSSTALQKLTLASLISSESWALFDCLGISDTAWLKTPPSTWDSNESYHKLKKFVTSLLVTNDCAERGVALISDYIEIVTKDEDQRQHLLQGVELHRKSFPNAKKSTLM